ncbi:hypothetical protein GCM10027028_58980 [Streptomyces sundarbansensis]
MVRTAWRQPAYAESHDSNTPGHRAYGESATEGRFEEPVGPMNAAEFGGPTGSAVSPAGSGAAVRRAVAQYGS